MPTYEYQCTAGHKFERFQSITDEPQKTCLVDKHAGSSCCAISTCNAPCRRLISGGAFILKGTGWAKDGYSSSGEKKKSGGEKKSSKPKEG